MTPELVLRSVLPLVPSLTPTHPGREAPPLAQRAMARRDLSEHLSEHDLSEHDLTEQDVSRQLLRERDGEARA